VVSLQVARERARQPRGGSNGHVSKRSNQRLLERLEAENARLRRRVMELMLEIQALREAFRHPQSKMPDNVENLSHFRN
jgi:cell division protein FtsB